MFHWREMKAADLPEVVALSEAAHPDLPESLETQAARLRLFPEGCLVLSDGASLGGYAFAHPIKPDQPPALDAVQTTLPPEARHLYLHDVAIAPDLRGGGHAKGAIERLLQLGRRFDAISLISVYGTAKFWSGFGFAPKPLARPEKLASYGESAVFMSRRP